MKRYITLLLVLVFTLSFAACSNYSNIEKKQMKQDGPQNIDKNNVGITENEVSDQVDSSLIEGNLENNDFKN